MEHQSQFPSDLTQSTVMPPTPPKPGNPYYKVIILGLILAGVAASAAAYAYYQGYSLVGYSVLGPRSVWEKFAGDDGDKSYRTRFSVAYKDHGTHDTGSLGFQLSDIMLAVEGEGYFNLADPGNPQADTSIKYTIGSRNTNFASGFKYRVLGQSAYYDVGDIPIIGPLVGSYNNRGHRWIKVDALKTATSTDPAQTDLYDYLSQPSTQARIKEIWKFSKLIKLEKYLGRENVGEANTLRFKAALDEAELKQALTETMELAVQGNGELSSSVSGRELAELINSSASELLDKLEIKEFELWLGAKDQNIYQIRLLSNAPSVISIVRSSEAALGLPDMPGENDKDKARRLVGEFIRRLEFAADLKVESTYSDYGKILKVEEPANPLDLFELLQQQGDGLEGIVPPA